MTNLMKLKTLIHCKCLKNRTIILIKFIKIKNLIANNHYVTHWYITFTSIILPLGSDLYFRPNQQHYYGTFKSKQRN